MHALFQQYAFAITKYRRVLFSIRMKQNVKYEDLNLKHTEWSKSTKTVGERGDHVWTILKNHFILDLIYIYHILNITLKKQYISLSRGTITKNFLIKLNLF